MFKPPPRGGTLGPQAPPRLRITRGTYRDYLDLAPLHYRVGRPATIVRALVARVGGINAGVLTVSMPTLNGSWRRRAWPELFEHATKRQAARRLNHPSLGVRCISRVIVDPRFRGAGIATALVRAYLRRPLTLRTEAISTMARATSFFLRAGMQRIDLPVAPAEARLMDLLEHLNIQPWEISAPARTLRRALRNAGPIGPALLQRELEHWRRSSRAAKKGLRLEDLRACSSRQALRPPSPSLFAAACARLGPRPIAFVTVSPSRGKHATKTSKT